MCHELFPKQVLTPTLPNDIGDMSDLQIANTFRAVPTGGL